MNRTSTLFTVAGVTVLGGLLAYAAYFDYKRRNDIEFRKKLRKDKKRVDKTVAQSKESEAASSKISTDDLRAALEKVKTEETPKTADEREHYFMSQVSLGEQLCTQGPAFHLPAALSFYRALRVYPSPVELIVIYQKTVPEPVFKMVMEMTNLDVSSPSSSPGIGGISLPGNPEDETSPTRGGPPSETSSQEWDKVKDRVEGYYQYFPPKYMDVSVKSVDIVDSNGNEIRKKVLIVNKDVKAGEAIYTEAPIVTALDFDLQGKGSHCSHCLRHIQKGMAIKPDSDRLDSVYCSKDCQVKSKAQSHNLLFTLEPPLPAGMAPEMSAQAQEDREAAQAAYVSYIMKTAQAVPLLVARFIARQVAVETTKMIPGGNGGANISGELPTADGGDYTLYDHMERLRYLEITAPEEEMKLLREVLQTALPGLEQFITDERHATLLGKMAYNAYGVCFGGGRDDRPVSSERPEDKERTRTPYGTSRQIGSGLYLVSAYLQHSCAPSARPSFSGGTAELHLIASRDLQKGDEINVAYVDVTQHPGESAIECRRRRRMELARGWRFACTCSRCSADADGVDEQDKDMPSKDESKIEATVSRIDDAQAAAPS